MRIIDRREICRDLGGIQQKKISPHPPLYAPLHVIFLPEERERKEGNTEYFLFFLSSGIPEEKGGGILSLFPSFPLFLPTFLPVQ